MDARRSAVRTGETRDVEDPRGVRRPPPHPRSAQPRPQAHPFSGPMPHQPWRRFFRSTLPSAYVYGVAAFCVQRGDPDEIRHGKKADDRFGGSMSFALTEGARSSRPLHQHADWTLAARIAAGPEGQRRSRTLQPAVGPWPLSIQTSCRRVELT
jgi:hypothetical protein